MTPLTMTLPEPQPLSAADVVAALRTRSSRLIDTELSRLDARIRPDAHTRAEIVTALSRIAGALLEGACARITTRAGTPDGDRYLSAAQELFALTPATANGRPR